MHSVDATTEQMIRSVLAYAENRLRLDPVPLDEGARDPAALDAALSGLLGDLPHNPDQVLGVYTSCLAPAVISADSPRFLGFIPAAPTKAALLFDMLISCASIQGISWLEAAGAIAAENQVLRLIADRAGLPASAGGCFVSGGSAANLSALVVAREVAKRRAGEGTGGSGEGGTGGKNTAGRRWRVAVSSDAHSSIAATLRILEMDPLTVPTDDHRMTGAALRAAIEADGDPSSLAAVVATSGTTNAGIIDDLAGTAAVCRELGAWFHVDGAYGGAGLFAPSIRHAYDGIEHADSFIVDPHKWLFAPFDCAALIYRDPSLARSVHRQRASYLDVIHADPAEWNPTDYAYHLTRRARGLLRRDRGRHQPGPPGRGRDRDPRLPGADPRAPAGRGAVPPPGLDARAVLGLGRPAAARPGGVHPADGVGGRDRGQVRVLAPAHLDGPGPRDPRPDAVAPRHGARQGLYHPAVAGPLLSVEDLGPATGGRPRPDPMPRRRS
jgi:aromatic-L-amino-acid/L-tryptophan decarboxylase